MAVLKQKLRGYILLESILAMIIVMACFAAAAMIYNNVITGMRGRLQLQARLTLEQEAIKARNENRLISESLNTDVMNISKTVELYKNSSTVYLLMLTATDKEGRTLAIHRELIRKP
ncbi:MAG: hypothetical protein ACRC3B_21460 [Bacteroidia bacterium]